MKKQHISAGADKNFFNKLEATGIFSMHKISRNSLIE